MTEQTFHQKTQRFDKRTRVLVLLAIVFLIAVGLDIHSKNDAQASSSPKSGAAVPPANTLSSTWYCAAGSSNPGGLAAETIIIANIGDTETQLMVTIITGGNPISRTYNVAARTTERIRVADIVQVKDPGVIVEAYGGQVAVSHLLSGSNDMAVGPCQNQLTKSAYFAAGTTQKGAQQWLTLFNPTGTDAIVDVTFFTSDPTGKQAIQQPGSLQGLEVARQSKLSIPVHDVVRRTQIVATQVVARSGRLAAEQLLTFDGTNGTQGLALSAAASAPASEFDFPSGSVSADQSESMLIANPNQNDAEVEIATVFDGPNLLEPQSIVVPATGVMSVNLGDRIPAGSHVSLAVRSTNNVKIIAEKQVASPAGVATEVGASQPANKWLVSPARITGASDDAIGIQNLSTKKGHVTISAIGPDGSVSRTLQTKNIAAAGRLEISLKDIPIDATVIVSSDTNIVTDRVTRAAQGITLTSAIPFASANS